jgi:hypothetical protein
VITEEQLESALTFMKREAAEYAKSKADRRYLEEFRKTLKSRLFMSAPEHCKTDKAKESWAYAHDEYEKNLVGLQVAVEWEEKLRWQLEAARITTEIYRTQSANNRYMDRAAQ